MCNAGGFWMPSDEETKLTKGFAFIEFLTSEVSEHAIPQFACVEAASCILLQNGCRKHKQPSSTPRGTIWISGTHSKSPCLMSSTSISRSQMDMRSLKARTTHPPKTCRLVVVPHLFFMNDKCYRPLLCATCIQSWVKRCPPAALP